MSDTTLLVLGMIPILILPFTIYFVIDTMRTCARTDKMIADARKESHASVEKLRKDSLADIERFRRDAGADIDKWARSFRQ